MSSTLTTAQTVAMFRTRAYRFSDEPREHALAELLEERLRVGQPLDPAALALVGAALEGWRQGERRPVDTRHAEERWGIHVDEALGLRRRWHATRVARREPRLVICVLGAPRSGTSYLYNLLAAQQQFAYFTNLSAPYWPGYLLACRPPAVRDLPPAALVESDTTGLKLRSDVVIPDEAEGIWARTVPVYRHLRGHSYLVRRPVVADQRRLSVAIAQHLEQFDSDVFLTKSPFHTFRIPALLRLFGARVRLVHIHRDGRDASRSIEERGFLYRFTDPILDQLGPWEAHIEAIRRWNGRTPMLHVPYEEAASDPLRTLRAVYRWLGLPFPPEFVVPAATYRPRQRPGGTPSRVPIGLYQETARRLRPAVTAYGMEV